MNLQFSLSTNAASSTSSTRRQLSDSDITQSSMLLRAAKTGIDLSRLEQQGVSISLGDEQLIKAIDRAVRALQGPATTLEMSVHEKTHQILVKVLNKDTG
ncbi:flagellar protein FlaG, partial [Paenibacillus polymyxa]